MMTDIKMGWHRLGMLVLLGVAVGGLALGVWLAKKQVAFKTEAQVSAVEMYIIPANQTMPPDSTYSLMLDTKNQQTVFSRAVFEYNFTKVELKGDITPSGKMADVVQTNIEIVAGTSNKRVTLVLAVPFQDPIPSGIFELAKFNLTTVSQSTNDTTDINFAGGDCQIVDESGNNLPINTKGASISLNQAGASPSPTLLPTVVPSPTPTTKPSPTVTPTSVPTASCASVGGNCKTRCTIREQQTSYKCDSAGTVCCIF